MIQIGKRPPRLLVVSARTKPHVPGYPRQSERISLDFSDASNWPFSPLVAGLVLAAAAESGCVSESVEMRPSGPKNDNAAVVLAPEKTSPEPQTGRRSIESTRVFESRASEKPPALYDRVPRIASKGGVARTSAEVFVASLSAAEAIEAVRDAFSAHGIELAADVRYDQDQVLATLDGYNKELKVGFEWIDRRAIKEESVDGAEADRLFADANQGKRFILPLFADDTRFRGSKQEAALAIGKAIDELVDHLRYRGAF